MKLTELDSFSMYIGALCHDVKHTGQNNMFHINSRSKIATRYNGKQYLHNLVDVSVLENYHVASTFKIISDPPYDIFKPFEPEEYRIMRRRMIEGILATDMAYHQKSLSGIKAKVETYNIKQGVNFEKIFNVETNKLFDAQQNVLNMCLHCSDISNPGKPNKISDKWTDMVYQEFFLQGDLEKEKGLPVSLLCDRATTNINKAMVGFITFVVLPSFELLVNLIPEISIYPFYIQSNLKKYETELKKEVNKASK